jgi:transcriptional regulator with XRE-family HTH domain
MPEPFDLIAFGERLRQVRTERQKTLKQVSDETGISIATISRIERGEANEVESKTLATLANWMNVSLDLFSTSPKISDKKPRRSTPDVVEIHLRADKNLDSTTATILSKMFRAAYEQMVKEFGKG